MAEANVSSQRHIIQSVAKGSFTIVYVSLEINLGASSFTDETEQINKTEPAYR
jgi:hypothetical protein